MNSKITFILVCFQFIAAHVSPQTTHQKIQGAWISEEDPKSKWVFTSNNKCKRYYNNELLYTYDFAISNTSCYGTTDSEFEYLKLTISSPKEKKCYAIQGITVDTHGDDQGTYLSLEFHGNPRPMSFKKQ